MGGVAEAQLEQAVEAMAKRDAALAERVIEADARIDALEKDVDHLAVRLLALRHPTRAVITGVGDARPMILRRSSDVAQFCQRLVDAHAQLAERYREGTVPPAPSDIASLLRQNPTLWLVSDLSHWQPDALAACLPQARINRTLILQPIDRLESDLPDVGVLQGFQNILAQTLCADQRCDNNHGQGQHDRLVDPCHDVGQCQRQLAAAELQCRCCRAN